MPLCASAGPLLARLGHVAMPLPGGCDIGSRPVDLHIRGLAAMGAQVDMRDGRYHLSLRAPLQGTAIFLDYPSVGATETLLMAGTVASGTTTISNAAMEPEVRCRLAVAYFAHPYHCDVTWHTAAAPVISQFDATADRCGGISLVRCPVIRFMPLAGR